MIPRAEETFSVQHHEVWKNKLFKEQKKEKHAILRRVFSFL
jgi:hypothetical protein